MTEIKNARLRELKARAEAAGRRFSEGAGRLYQADGSPLFAEDVLRTQLEELARERNRELLAIEEEAREIAAGAGGIIERLEHADPADLLTDEELARANAWRGFANDQAASLPVEDLRKRLDSVLHGGDRAAIFAHLLAGQRRRQTILERRREAAAASGPGGTPAAYSDITALDEALAAMRRPLAESGRRPS